MIGLIENDWKLMISEWVSDDGEDDSPLKSGETVKILIDSEVVRLVEAADNEPESTQDITVVLAGDNAPGPSDFLFDRNSDGVINQLDASVVYVPGEDSDSQVTAVVTSVTVSSGVATVGVKLTGVVDETFASDAVATTTDSVKVTFETTGSIDDLMDEIGARIVDPIDGHNAFDDLCVKTDVCPEATALMNAINAHAKNLGLGVGTTGASIFANSVVGVSDGDDLEIRYSDPTPGEGTQRASATVDTIAPTIGGFDPANDSFTTDDRFDSVFTVTDGGSGIFEDAEEVDLSST